MDRKIQIIGQLFNKKIIFENDYYFLTIVLAKEKKDRFLDSNSFLLVSFRSIVLLIIFNVDSLISIKDTPKIKKMRFSKIM